MPLAWCAHGAACSCWLITATHRHWRVLADFMINIQLLLWGSKQLTATTHTARVCDAAAATSRMDEDRAATWMDMAIAHARQVPTHASAHAV